MRDQELELEVALQTVRCAGEAEAGHATSTEHSDVVTTDFLLGAAGAKTMQRVNAGWTRKGRSRQQDDGRA